MFRLGIEKILGLKRTGGVFQIDPCIPSNWPGFSLTCRFGKAEYMIRIENPDFVSQGIKQVTLNGQVLPDGNIPIVEKRGRYKVIVCMG